MSARAEYRIEGIDAFAPPQSYAVHNATDDIQWVRFDGEERAIPPFTKVAEKIPSRLDGPVLDSKGAPRPGTLAIFDVQGERACSDGGRAPFWSAREAIKHSLGIDTTRGVATGPSAEKGLSFIPANCTDAQFAKIAREGRARYMLWIEKHAVDVVAAYDERNNNRVKAGMGRIPGDAVYQRALAVLEAARNRDAAKAAEEIKNLEEQLAEPIQMNDDDAEFVAFIRDEVSRIARKSDLETDADKLVEQLEKNPEAMAKLRTKYKVRKLRDSRKPDGAPVVLESDELMGSDDETPPETAA